MHRRSVHQTVVDLNLLRPIDFAVVDGIWGMEGNGPLLGTPVRMETVVAGRNALAVDRVCLAAMDLPQNSVQHLEYAARKGLGPAGIREIEARGDSLTPYAFRRARTLPVVEYPRSDPNIFAPTVGQRTRIVYAVDSPCWTRLDIVRTDDVRPVVTHIRTVRQWTQRPAGVDSVD